MLFWVANALSKYMQLMIDLLGRHIKNDYCIIFIDNMLIYSKDDEEHSCHIESMLNTIRKAGLRLQQAKCSFGRTKIPF
jgi:hypothetical protein